MLRKKLRTILYILGFFFSLQIAIPTYINSSFIGQHLSSASFIGLLFSISSILSIIILLILPNLLKKIGNFKSTLLFILLNTAFLSLLAFPQNRFLIFLAFIGYLTLGTVIYFNLDIFLEKQSTDKETGNIRGVYLTIINFAWVLSPLLAGFLLTNGNYWKIYLISACFSLPFITFLLLGFRKSKDPIYKISPFWTTLKKISKKRNILNIFAVKTFLNFFYAWMIIYTPIYLHEYIGLGWTTIGVIFTIMLLPFVIFQLPLGILADKRWGEKEILSIGLIIISLATISLSFITTTQLWVWAMILFITRIGASAVEIMSESYFFKHIDEKDADIISFFSITRPFAYTIAPLVTSLLLLLVNFRYVFIFLGLIMLFSLRFGLTLKDTK